MTVRTPRLTRLDQAVADALPAAGARGRRLAAITADVAERLSGPGANPHPRLERDVRLILRGLEHLGRANSRNGWWTR